MKFIKPLMFIPIFSVVFGVQAASASPAPTTPQLAPPLDDVEIYSGQYISMGANTIINSDDNIHSIGYTTLGAGAELGGDIDAGAYVTLGASARARGNITAGAGATLGGDARVGGKIWSGDFATLGATSIAGTNAGYIMVEGNVNAGGPVILGKQSIVNGNITSGAYGSIILHDSTEVGGYAKAGTTLTLGKDTTVGFNSDPSQPNSNYGLAGSGSINLDLRAKLKGNATAGTSITLGASATIDGTQFKYTPTTLTDNDPDPVHNAKAELTQLQATLSEHKAPLPNELIATQTEDRTFLAGVYHAADFTTTAGITITFDGENKEAHWLINADTFIAFGAGIKMKYTRIAPNSTITWNSKGYISIGAGTPLERSEVLGTFFASQYISTGAQVQLKGIDNRCGGLYATNGYVTLGAANTMGLIDCKVGPPPTAPDYFKVSHDNLGIHCAAEPVSVTARNADHSITTGYNGTITLDTQTGKGGWNLDTGSSGSLVDTTPNDGLATYTFDTADNGVAEFLLYYTEGTPTFDIDAYEGAVRDDDSEGNMTFSASGFTITASESTTEFTEIPTQIAGDDFKIFISAFGTKPEDGTCGIIETYDPGNKNLDLTTAYSNPSSGKVSATFNNGTGITFNNGQAEIITKYQDVGMISFNFTDGDLKGSSNDFVVKPHSYEITLGDGVSGSDYEAINATDSVYTKAGVDFNVTVTAKGSDGVTTPNYGKESPAETVHLSHELVQPKPGAEGDLIFNLSKTGNGIYSGTANWSEVGIINLTATVGDEDYLGTGNVSSTLNNVGRFTPAKLSITTIDNGSFISTNKTGTENFTYVGQKFSYDPDQRPSFKITALNALSSATTTLNYTGDWGKLSADSIAFTGPSSDSDQGGKDASTLMLLTYKQDTAGFRDDAITANQPKAVNGIFNVTFTNDDFTYGKDHNSEISPFNPSVNLVITNVEDLDGISTGTFTLNPTGTEPIRFGKMRMYSNGDSELETLVMDYRLEYFDSNFWVLHDDKNSTIATGDIFSNPTGISAISIEPITTPKGKFEITLSPHGKGNSGDYIITTNLISAGLPWLQYDWDLDGNYDDNPSATATFGIRQDDGKMIYRSQSLN